MTAKKYLKQLIDLGTYVKARQEDYELAYVRATQMTQRHNEIRVQTSGSHNGQEDLLIRCVELSDELDRATSELMDLQHEARRLINKLSDNRYRALLNLRYVQGRSWAYVSENMGYDLRWVHRLHGQALAAFDQQAIESHYEFVL